MLTWKELERMLASRRAKAQSEAMTPEQRKARAAYAVSQRKWRPKKATATEVLPSNAMGEEKTGTATEDLSANQN